MSGHEFILFIPKTNLSEKDRCVTTDASLTLIPFHSPALHDGKPWEVALFWNLIIGYWNFDFVRAVTKNT
jgi:hypothetical protein